MRILAFIPARGGSKGIPNKNLALLNKKPLIYYTIEAAKLSCHVTDIFLSSDDPEIIRYSASLGIQTPYIRPSELAEDGTPTIDTVLHGLEWLRGNSPSLPETILLLQPTSPFRTPDDIDSAVEAFLSSTAKSLVSVHTQREHPYKCVESIGKNWSYLKKPAENNQRRQDYPDNFNIINGAVYIVSSDFIFSRKTLVVENETMLYHMSPRNGLDIDEPIDLKWAEFYMKYVSSADRHK